MHENQVRTTFAPDLRPAKGSTKEAERLSLLIASLVVSGVLTCWQCKQVRVGRHKGFFAGGYKLLDQIPDGAAHRSYLAENTTTGNRVQLTAVGEGDSFRFRISRDGELVEEIVEHRDEENLL
jgi:hypothetical protein